MKLNVLALTVAATVLGLAAAQAQTSTTVVREGNSGKTVVIKKNHPDVVVRKRVETTGSNDCNSRTVHRNTPAGSTTVRRTHCD